MRTTLVTCLDSGTLASFAIRRPRASGYRCGSCGNPVKTELVADGYGNVHERLVLHRFRMEDYPDMLMGEMRRDQPERFVTP